MWSEPLRHDEVAHRVFMGIVAEQPMETNIFPRVLEGLLGRLSIAAPGEMDPPASSKEGAAQLWASAVLDAVQKTEGRRVKLQTPEPSGLPPGVHITYEEVFLSQ